MHLELLVFLGVDERAYHVRRKKIGGKLYVVPLPNDTSSGIHTLAQWVGFKARIPSGLSFATRPFNLPELYVVAPKVCEACNQDGLKDVVQALRGFTPGEKMPSYNDKETTRPILLSTVTTFISFTIKSAILLSSSVFH